MSVVFTNGCFDILHRGHIELLRFCRSLGDKVIVGINSDASVKLLKGDRRPVNCQLDRKIMLESLRFVDEVIIFDEPTPIELIEKIRPSIIVKGGDYSTENVVGKDIAKVVIFGTLDGYSTSQKIKDIAGR
jgi:rfaE bifunctional protein nucleotidyltransferase chain/domain